MNEHVVAALSRPELAPLVAELTRRMGASDRAVVSVQVQLDHAGREALAGLLGATRIPPSPARVKIADLIRRLDTDTDGLRRALEKVSGPIGNRAAERQTRRDAVAAAADDAAAAAEPLGPSLQAWARVTVSSLTGPVDKRLADVGCVLAVVAEPRDRPQPLPVVAAKALCDAHAFDYGTRLGELLASCCAAAASLPAPTSAHAWRDAVATVGIVADELSSSVTTWNLHPGAGHPLAGSVAAIAARDEPAVWTLSMLRRWPLTNAPTRVLVVENPSVLAVAAADSYDGTVVCCSGRPTVATTLLLQQLAIAGASIDAHADFDEAGLGIIANFAAAGYRPWRMTAASYLAHLDSAGPARGLGAVPITPWDPELSATFAQHRRPLFEELVIDEILS